MLTIRLLYLFFIRLQWASFGITVWSYFSGCVFDCKRTCKYLYCRKQIKIFAFKDQMAVKLASLLVLPIISTNHSSIGSITDNIGMGECLRCIGSESMGEGRVLGPRPQLEPFSISSSANPAVHPFMSVKGYFG